MLLITFLFFQMSMLGGLESPSTPRGMLGGGLPVSEYKLTWNNYSVSVASFIRLISPQEVRIIYYKQSSKEFLSVRLFLANLLSSLFQERFTQFLGCLRAKINYCLKSTYQLLYTGSLNLYIKSPILLMGTAKQLSILRRVSFI